MENRPRQYRPESEKPKSTDPPKPQPESQEGNPPVSPLEQNEEESATKPSRIPDQKIVFVQHAFASGADDRLDERRRIFLAHAVTKPHLTLQELAPFAGVRTAERARQLWDSSLKALWQASPPELQQQYPLDLLRRHRSAGIIFSAKHRAQMSEAHKGKQPSPETVAKIAVGNAGKKRTPEQRANMSAATRKNWERRKQHNADLT